MKRAALALRAAAGSTLTGTSSQRVPAGAVAQLVERLHAKFPPIVAPAPQPSSGWGALPWAAACSAFLLPVLAHADSTEDKPSWGLISLESKRRIFFKYEKRIRDNSTLEKVFDYFSNLEKDGMKYMTPLDLLAAIVPTYPASQSNQDRSGSLDGEPAPRQVVHAQLQKASETIFKHFDMDGDGCLSFWEYSLVLTLLSIPEADVEVIFNVVDADASGSVDASEFHQVIASLQQGRLHSRAPHTRLGHASGIQAEGEPSGLLIAFFGKDQLGKLSLKQFMSFLAQLHSDMAELEFMHYDVNARGTVPGIDFARSLVTVADVRAVDELLNKVDSLPPALLQTPISKKDFQALVGLSRKSHRLEVALHFCLQVGRVVTRTELEKMLKRLCDVELSPQAMDIVIGVFADANGRVDVQLFSQMLLRRANLWSSRVRAEAWSGGGAFVSS